MEHFKGTSELLEDLCPAERCLTGHILKDTLVEACMIFESYREQTKAVNIEVSHIHMNRSGPWRKPRYRWRSPYDQSMEKYPDFRPKAKLQPKRSHKKIVLKSLQNAEIQAGRQVWTSRVLGGDQWLMAKPLSPCAVFQGI